MVNKLRGVSFAPAEKLSLAQALLGRLKVDRIEVASAGVSQGEQEAVKKINSWAAANGHLHKVEVLGFVDLDRSVDWITGAGGKVINLLAKGSEKTLPYAATSTTRAAYRSCETNH